MTLGRYRIVSAALAAATAAALAAAAPASVSAETLTCRLSATGTFEPGMFLASGAGSYTVTDGAGLTSETLCSHNEGPSVESAITTTGRFSNFVCGTASFESPGAPNQPSIQIDVGRDGTFEVSQMRYRMESVGWQARLEASEVNGRAVPSDDAPEGLLVLRPQHACTSVPVTRFTADGVLALDW